MECKDDIFFGERGLTSSSANHIANVAKETVKELEKKLQSLLFYSHAVRYIPEEKETVIRKGLAVSDFSTITDALERIIEVKQLISWIREALKAKDRKYDKVQSMTDEEVYSLLGKTFPERPEPAPMITKQEVVETKPMAEQIDYSYLVASQNLLNDAVGKYGSYTRARDDFYHKLGQKSQVSESYHLRCEQYSCEKGMQEAVEDVYMILREQFLDADENLHEKTSEIEEEAEHINLERIAENSRKYLAYVEAARTARLEVKLWREKEREKVANLRIVIPKNLEGIYAQVSEMGKKKSHA